MVDYAHKQTDIELHKLEAELAKQYLQAKEETEAKLQDFLSRYEKKLAVKTQQKAAGEISQADYNHWVTGQIMMAARWKEMVDTLAEDFSNVNKIAAAMTKGFAYDVYALNHNYGTFEVEKGSLVNTSYTLYDRFTVERLVRDKPEILPPPGKKVSQKIKEGQMALWNKKKIRSVMLQSVLQGESIPQIAKRLATEVGDSNMKAAIRNARTMTTSAENGGRVDSYVRAKGLGITMKQVWVATLDGRTRHSHRMLDGQKIAVGGVFSNKCRFPGDPEGPAQEVYNCRCTLIGEVDGVNFDLSDVTQRNDKLGGMTYQEWKGKQAYADPEIIQKFGNMKITHIHNLLKEIDSKGANEFYQELQALQDVGMPSEIWKKYLTGQLDAETVKKLDKILKKYLSQGGLIDIEGDASTVVSVVDYSALPTSPIELANALTAIDPALVGDLSNAFFTIQKATGLDWDSIFNKYIKQELDPTQMAELDKIVIKKYSKMAAVNTPTTAVDYSQLSKLTIPEIYKTLTNVDPALAKEFKDTFNTVATNYSGDTLGEVWHKYINQELDPADMAKLDAILVKQYSKAVDNTKSVVNTAILPQWKDLKDEIGIDLASEILGVLDEMPEDNYTDSWKSYLNHACTDEQYDEITNLLLKHYDPSTLFMSGAPASIDPAVLSSLKDLKTLKNEIGTDLTQEILVVLSNMPEATFPESWEAYLNHTCSEANYNAITNILLKHYGSSAVSGDDTSTIAKEAQDQLDKLKIKPGNPMTKEDADTYKVNPFYDKTDKTTTTNCQTCSFVYELRRQGYDVIALPKNDKLSDIYDLQKKLGEDQANGWINKATGKMPEALIKEDDASVTLSNSAMFADLQKNIGTNGERYILGVRWSNGGSHSICIDRDENGNLRIIDNQRGPGEKNTWTAAEYFNTHGIKNIRRLYRVDDCVPNAEYFNKIVGDASKVKLSMPAKITSSDPNYSKLYKFAHAKGETPALYYLKWKLGIIDDPDLDNIFNSSKVTASVTSSTVTPAATPAASSATDLDFDAFKNKSASKVWKELNDAKAGGSKFWKDITDIGKKMGIKPAEAWKKYLAGDLDADDTAKIEKHLAKLYKKAATTTTTSTTTSTTTIDYSKYGGKEIYDILSKYENYSDLLVNGTSNEYLKTVGFFGDYNHVAINNAIHEIQKTKAATAATTTTTSTPALEVDFDAIKNKSALEIFNDIKATDNSTANKLWMELSMVATTSGSVSDAWNDYLYGAIPDANKKKIDDLLIKKYSKPAASTPTSSTTATGIDMNLLKTKKVSKVWNELKAQGGTAYSQFWKIVGDAGKDYGLDKKQSKVWQMYLDGQLKPEESKKIDDFLLKHYFNKSSIQIDYSKYGGKEIYDILSKYKDISDFIVNGPLDELTKVDAAFNHDTTKMKTIIGEIQKLKTAPAVSTEPDDLTKAKEKLKKAEDDLAALGNKTYSGIWKDDVTLADYNAKKGTIAAKKIWYQDELDELTGNPDYKNWWTEAQKKAKIAEYQKYIQDLDEFEQKGKEYLKKLKAVNKAKQEVQQLEPKPIGGKFDPDDYGPKAKKDTEFFTSATKADKMHRAYLDQIWDSLTDNEKYSIWEYTRNSNPMNKRLSGYGDTNDWSRDDFVGYDKTVWGLEDSWRSLPSAFEKFGKNGHCTYHQAITDATKAVEKSVLPQNTYLVRGSSNEGFAGLIEGKGFMPFDTALKILKSGDINQIKAAFEGQVVKNHAFTSSGIAKGTGFSGQVKYEIYAPRGTHGIYAEPQSYFGDTVGSRPKLYKTGMSYRDVGGEAEVILQRGTEFRITEIKKVGSALVVRMEVVSQPDYFKYGDEDTYNDGATRHKK